MMTTMSPLLLRTTTDVLRDLYQRNAEIAEELTGLTPTTSVTELDPSITETGLAELQRLGINGVVVQPQHLEPLDNDLFGESLTTRFLIPAPGVGPIPAVAVDRDLSDHFLSNDTTTIAANRLLADLALLSLDNPDVIGGVIISAPLEWEPDASFLNIVLSGLERIPTLRGASPQEVLTNTAFTPSRGPDTLSPPLQRQIQSRRNPTDLRSFRTEFNQAAATIDAWSTVIASDVESVSRLSELLELSTSGERSLEERSVFIEQIYNIIDDQKNDAITAPPSETITLTGRNFEVPVLIDNNLSINTEVILVFDSEKLDFPDGRELAVVLEPGSNRIDVPIEARGSGDSPIRIQIFSPDRSILLGSGWRLAKLMAQRNLRVMRI